MVNIWFLPLRQYGARNLSRHLLLAGVSASALLIAEGATRAAEVIDGGATVAVPGDHATPWNVGDELQIGVNSTGTLNINTTGVVNSTDGQLGLNTGSNGTVNITGAGSQWNLGGLNVGVDGTGTLNASGGAIISSGGSGGVGNNTGATGTVVLDNAQWNMAGNLAIAPLGSATVTVSNGGILSNNYTSIAELAGGSGMVTVTGAGSQWNSLNTNYVGKGGDGTLNILAGGLVTAGYVPLGYYAGSSGLIQISGAGSTLTTSLLQVGNDGLGTLNVINGGTLNSDGGSIGNGGGGSAGSSLRVNGAGSTWNAAGGIYIAGGGAASVTVDGGGAIISGEVGIGSGSAATVTISDAGSSWTSSGDVYTGGPGGATVNILAGGVLSNVNGYASNSTITVSGTGSAWNNSGELDIGADVGTTTLEIKNGATVTSAAAYLGYYDPASIGQVTISGNAANWTTTGNVTLGVAGTGTITVTNGGTLSVNGGAGSIRIADQSGSFGTLNIGADSSSSAGTAGTVSAASVSFGDGTGTLVFNHTSNNYVFAAGMSGAGAITAMGGTTNLTGNSAGFTGQATVSNATLAVNGQFGGDVTIVGGGTLKGSGTVGSITALPGGTVAPGNSIGTMTVNNNVTFNSGTTYQVELNAAGQSDRINATGTATLNGGTVRVPVGSTFNPAYIYTILSATGGVTGTFAGLVFSSPTQATPFSSVGLAYDANNVYIQMTRNNVAYASAGATPNQIAAAGGIDSVGGGALYTAISGLSLAQARNAFDLISGEIHASAKTALIEDSRLLRESANDRLRSTVSYGPDLPSAAMSYAPPEDSGTPFAMRNVVDTDRRTDWLRAFGSFAHADSDGNAARLNYSTGGFVRGMDGAVTRDSRLGLMAGYSYTGFSTDSRGSGSSSNYHLGIYGGSQMGRLALRSSLGFTLSDIDTSRVVSIPGFTDQLRSNYLAQTYQAFAELAYRMGTPAWSFEPFANVAYVGLRTNGFGENGGAAALSARSETTSTAFTTLGLRQAAAFAPGMFNGATAFATVGWRHAFGDMTPDTNLSFAGGASFTVQGGPIAEDAALIEAGLDFRILPMTSFGVSYTGQFASNATSNGFNVKLSGKF